MEPNPLAIVALCFVGAAGLIFLFWLNHKLRGRPKSETPAQEENHAPPSPRLVEYVMSYLLGAAGPIEPVGTEQRSDAVERRAEPSGTPATEPVPDLVEQLAALDDDALLDILALLPGDGEDWRFAESRIAKFIPGRVEDRLTQVRDIRGTEKPAPPGRTLRVRDAAGERIISFVEGRR